MSRLQFTAPITIRAEAGSLEKGTILMQPAYSGGPLLLNGWDYPAVVEVASIHAAADLIPCRVGHGQDEQDVLGQIAVSIDKGAVNAAGRVTNRESPGPRAVLSMAAAGHQFQASIGGEPARKEFIPPGREIEINGQTFVGPLYACYDTTLGEISVVSLGADTTTSTSIAAQAAKGQAAMADEKKDEKDEKPDFTAFCKAAGFDPATMNDNQKAAMTGIHAKLYGAAAESDPGDKEEKKTEDSEKKETEKGEAARKADSIMANHATDPIKARAASLRRAAAIEAKCKDHLDLAATAMEEGWDDKRIDNEIELKVLRAGRAQNKAPAGHVAGKGVDMGRALEASWMRSGGISADRLVKEYGEPSAVYAQRKLSGIGLRDTLRAMAAMSGEQLPSGNGSDFVEAVVHLVARQRGSSIEADGGATPISLPGILSNVAHKLLLEGYNHVEQTWKAVSKQGNLQDFKPHNRFRMTNDLRFQPLNTSGELVHGKLGEQAYIIQGDTEGIMFNLDRKLIINDDMSAFSEIPKMVGRGAGLEINRAFWTLFLSNAAISSAFATSGADALATGTNAFFSAANGNYLSGAGSALGVTGLAAAYTAQLRQTDPAGYPLGIEPTILLVPASLRYTAETLMLSRILVSQLAASGNGSLQPSENPLAGKFQVAASAYLDNSSFSGYSTTAWYLLLDPNAGYDVIEAAFLERDAATDRRARRGQLREPGYPVP